MKFNKEQQQAVSHREGPMLVLAGPGSGKTAVITQRTQQLIADYGIAPSSILVVTFTKAAARQMRERFLKLTGQTATQVTFGTFHGIFYGILRQAYGITSANIAGEEERLGILRRLIQKTSMDVDDENDLIDAVSREISTVKNGRISLDHYYSQSCPDEEFRRIFQEYERLLHGKRLLDFDDLMVYCWKLFHRHPEILAAWQKKFRYILVDEFQDVNQLQYDIVKLLALPENNLFIVGDDDQSIYRFRGARPELMLGFPKDYPQCGRVLLDVNYRSTPQIVEAAGRLIAHNKTRFAKEIRAVRRPGRPVITRVFQDGAMEAEAISRELRDYAKAGVKWEQMAVLFRTNLGPRLLVEKLMEYNIPFCLRDELPNLFDHWIARNILDYILAARGHMERARILSIINRPKRYVSRDALEGEMINWEQVKSFYQDKGWMVERIEDLEIHLMSIKKMAPAAAVNYIRKAVGYNEFLKEYAAFRRMKPEELYEIADQVQESAAQFQTAEAWFQHIARYREQLKEQARERNQKREGVSLMTMHSSKGLEFRVVFILDANEGVTPHHKAFLDADMEEERRMFYVAMTRAKERLHVYYVKERYHKKQEVSRFVKEYLEQEAK